MTHQASNLAKKSVALALAASLLAPTAFVFAEEATVRGDVKVSVGADFCTNIESLTGKVVAKVPKREDKRDEHLDNRVTKVNGRLQLRVEKLDDRREQWDENRVDRYAKIDIRATTTVQKEAVLAFKTNIDAAVKVRRTAVDAAVKAFQDGVNKLLADRQTKVDAAFATLKTATDAAVAKAKADCKAGKDPKTVRVQFAADIRAANTAFTASIKPAGDIETKVKALRTTRDAAVKAAVEAFKKTFDAELVKLKAAFGVSAQ